MMTQRDKEIVRFVEDFDFITITQCYNMWFSSQKYGYDLARKRLGKIEKEGYLKSYKDTSMYGSEKIFFIDNKYAGVSRHTILAQNVYSEFIRLGATVFFYKREQRWLDGKYRSDAYICFRLSEKIHSICVEIIRGTAGKPFATERDKMADKYSEVLLDANEPLALINSEFSKNGIQLEELDTSVLIVDDIEHKTDWYIDGIKVKQVPFTLSGISNIFL